MLKFCLKHKRIVSVKKLSQKNGECLECIHALKIDDTTKIDYRYPIKKSIEKYKRGRLDSSIKW